MTGHRLLATAHRLLATAHVGGKPGCHPVGCQNTHQRLEGEFFMKNSPFNSLLSSTGTTAEVSSTICGNLKKK